MKANINLEELITDGGSLPDVSVKASALCDWQRILMDAHADLSRQLCYYMAPNNDRMVKKQLLTIEAICKAWRAKGPLS